MGPQPWESVEHDVGGGIQTGTTIMAVAFDGGVVLGADSRTSSGNYGEFCVREREGQIARAQRCALCVMREDDDDDA